MIIALLIIALLVAANLCLGDVYTILKGHHFHSFHMIRIPRFVKSRFVGGEFRLPPSCYYEFENQDDYDLNKLVGVTRGLRVHRDSVRLAWRPEFERKNYFQIHAYVYDKGNRVSRYLTTVGAYEKITWEIMMSDGNYHFKVGEESLTMKKSKTRGWGFALYPYFGGDNKARQTMNIYLKWISYRSCGLFYLLAALYLMGCSTTKDVGRTQEAKDKVSTEVTTGKTYTETKITENADTVIIVPAEEISGTAPVGGFLKGDTIKVESSGMVVIVSVSKERVNVSGEKKPQRIPVNIDRVTETKKSEDVVTEKKDTDQTKITAVSREVTRNYWPWVVFGIAVFVIVFVVIYLKVK